MITINSKSKSDHVMIPMKIHNVRRTVITLLKTTMEKNSIFIHICGMERIRYVNQFLQILNTVASVRADKRVIHLMLLHMVTAHGHGVHGMRDHCLFRLTTMTTTTTTITEILIIIERFF